MTNQLDGATTVARCHEVQIALGLRNVPEYDHLTLVGMAVKVALHIRGLPAIDYETLKLVCSHLLDVPSFAVEQVVRLLADIGFVHLKTEGKTIKLLVPNVPYYEEAYERLGDYVVREMHFSEAEQLSLAIVDRLASAPDNLDRLRNQLGADPKLFSRNIDIGKQGRFLYMQRHRGCDILVNPIYFSENAEIFADAVAATNASQVAQLLDSLRTCQGWPLAMIKSQGQIGNASISPDQIRLLERLAQDGVVKPPTITTTHAGEHYFMFSPTPYATNLSPWRRNIHEKAMAIVAAMRQGQLLPVKYAIRSPAAVLHKLKSDLRLNRATTEFSQQYKNLVHLGVGRMVPVGNGFSEFHIVDTDENRDALDMAYDLVAKGETAGLDVDEEARRALATDHQYVESLVASAQLRERETITLAEEQAFELENLLLKGMDG